MAGCNSSGRRPDGRVAGRVRAKADGRGVGRGARAPDGRPTGAGPRRAVWARSCLAAAFALAGCRGGSGGDESGRAGAADATVVNVVDLVDERGQRVRLARRPARIASLLPSHTETLFALGAGADVVARDAFSDRPAAALALPAVGGLADLNVEALLALKPDLVLASEHGAQAASLEDAGLTVWAGSPQSYDEVFSTIDALGRLAGHAAEAAALNDRLRREVDEVAARVAGLPRVRVYYELDSTPYSVGPRSFVGVLLAKAGGETIVPPSLGDFPRLAPEDILARDPEVILGVTLDEVRRRPGWSRLRAARAGRVGALSPDERAAVLRPGPGLAEGVRVLARRLHPEAFP